MADYFVYMLASDRHGTLYTGVTNDLLRRISQHRTGHLAGFTKRYNVKKLVWFETTPDIRVATQREKNLKHWPRTWKITLIEKQNPDWRDLFTDIVG